MNDTRHAAIEAALHWQSDAAQHIDRLYFERINFWRDFFPGTLAEQLKPLATGASVSESFKAGELVDPFSSSDRIRVRHTQFQRNPRPGLTLEPRRGRFYPREFIARVPGIVNEDRRPCRVVTMDEEYMLVDLNHPLASRSLTVELTLLADLDSRAEHGGRATDIAYELSSHGPGMQALLNDIETDFMADDPLRRMDEREDALFYEQARMVQHLDACALRHITRLYGDLLKPGMRVLDLMASWDSHLPDELNDIDVTGLGMNEAELAENPRLRKRTVHDLNRQPVLPYADNSFDAAVCTVSIEYLNKPLEVLRSVARVLHEGAPFIVTFSDRWFPTKAINLWQSLHPFERQQLVLEWFRQAGFERLHSESVRGWPRPEDDAHAGERVESDPVFAVWGLAPG